jgi:GNAT superfamily N-acetyltransferase
MAVPLSIRKAVREDVPIIVELLADDPLGAQREHATDPLPKAYYESFEAIDADPNQRLVVGEREGVIIATLQLTFLPYLTYTGGWRAIIEAVRVARSARGQGLGRKLFEWAIEEARQRRCHVVQLTTDKQRPDALAFYESLGFEATHEGMKLHLPSVKSST